MANTKDLHKIELSVDLKAKPPKITVIISYVSGGMIVNEAVHEKKHADIVQQVTGKVRAILERMPMLAGRGIDFDVVRCHNGILLEDDYTQKIAHYLRTGDVKNTVEYSNPVTNINTVKS